MIGLRLSFIVSVISSPPGSHSVGRMRNRLICSTRDSLALPAATPAAICAMTSGSAASAAGDASDNPCRAAYGPTESASKTSSAVLYGRPSPMVIITPIIGQAARMAFSMLAGDMFFPAALMISSFLRSTTRR